MKPHDWLESWINGNRTSVVNAIAEAMRENLARGTMAMLMFYDRLTQQERQAFKLLIKKELGGW